jgi:hypothetical protein
LPAEYDEAAVTHKPYPASFYRRWGFMIRKLHLSLFILLSVLVLGPAVEPLNVSAQVRDRRFGAIEAFWATDEAAELGIGWERILFYWRELQPTGPDDWNTLHVREEWLAEAVAQGRTVVGLLKNTPPWASEDGSEAGLPSGLYLPVDDPGNLWANYVRRVASYYSARSVHHWIIWNEPEIRPDVYGYEFAGTVEDYYQLLKVAYKVMKETDPAAVIHLAGLTWWHDVNYLQRLFQVAAADPEGPANDYFFDVVSLHIYFRSETVQTILNNVQAIQEQFGMDKAVWINETNAAPNQDPLWPVVRPAFPVDLDQQAWYIVQAFALGFGAGADRISVYKLIDVQLPPGGEAFGILRPDFSRRPAFDAYKTTIRYLSDFSRTSREQGENYFVVSFERPQGVTRVMWARHADPVQLQVPALASEALLVGAIGDAMPITAVNGAYTIGLAGARCPGECIIGGEPYLLVEQGARLPSGGPPPAVLSQGAPVVTVIETAVPTVTPTMTPAPSATATGTAIPTSTPLPTLTLVPTGTPAGLGAINAADAVITAQPAPVQPSGNDPPDGQTSGVTDQIGLIFIGSGVVLAVALTVLLVRRARFNE